MEFETIKYEILEKGIGCLSLNRPHCYNAINYQMMIELESFWKDRLYDLDTVVIILRSECEKGFCAGLDLKETAELSPKMNAAEFYRFQARLARLNLAMRRAPQPIITILLTSGSYRQMPASARHTSTSASAGPTCRAVTCCRV